MRVAIFHDYFDAIGGGERVVLTLARAWNATVYASEVSPGTVERLGFRDVRVESLGEPVTRAPRKQIEASLRFARVRVDADAYVLSGNWATYAARRHHPNVAYCHTPVRVFYDQRDAFLRAQPDWIRRVAARTWTAGHRSLDRIAWTNVDHVVANSENTRRRIQTYLGRSSTVVHPPTDITRHRFERVGDFWLAVNRLYPEKRLEIQFEAFRRLPRERLIVVGGYARGDRAEAYANGLRPPPNVELRGEIDETDLLRLYAECRGLVCTAVDEDFGMTPVEAMASGKVVLAVDEGGFRETVVPGKTGFLLAPDPAAFADRIGSLTTQDLEARSDACRQRAMRFDESVFLAAMRTVVESAAGLGNRTPF